MANPFDDIFANEFPFEVQGEPNRRQSPRHGLKRRDLRVKSTGQLRACEDRPSSQDSQSTCSSVGHQLLRRPTSHSNFARRHANIEPNNNIELPCNQIAQLQLDSGKKIKKNKKLPKTISQLVNSKLFFLSKKQSSKDLKPSTQQVEQHQNKTDVNIHAEMCHINNLMDSTLEFDESQPDQHILSHISSESMIGLPGHTTADSSGYHSSKSNSITTAELSPIFVPRQNLIHDIVASTPTIKLPNGRLSIGGPENINHELTTNSDTSKPAKKDNKKSKYRNLTNTALVLRDVKNSIGLRVKARQENKAFEQFSNESMTSVSTSINSPCTNEVKPRSSRFRFMTNKVEEKKCKNRRDKKTKRTNNDSGHCSLDDSKDEASIQTPKGRIALQHKRHLFNNKFVFESPAGRLRKTVEDVEKFQQCIEDISEAIKARGTST